MRQMTVVFLKLINQLYKGKDILKGGINEKGESSRWGIVSRRDNRVDGKAIEIES